MDNVSFIILKPVTDTESSSRINFEGSKGATGLEKRTPDPLDGRVAWIQVTPAGRKLLSRVRRRHAEYLARKIKRLPPDELQTLERAALILDRITERPV